MNKKTEEIALLVLQALKDEWERDPSLLTCRPASDVLGPLKPRYNIEDADITRGIRFLVERGLLNNVQRPDGMASQPSLDGVDYLENHVVRSDVTIHQPSDSTHPLSIFISHSSQDKELAEALVNLLRNALNIPAHQIRCTSVNGYRLQAGAQTDSILRQEIRESKEFIGLITPASRDSAYVMFELGARWGAELHLVPLLGAGADTDCLPAPLKTLNALNCGNAGQVHQLVDDISKHLEIKERTPASAYHDYVDRLVAASKSSVAPLGAASL